MPAEIEVARLASIGKEGHVKAAIEAYGENTGQELKGRYKRFRTGSYLRIPGVRSSLEAAEKNAGYFSELALGKHSMLSTRSKNVELLTEDLKNVNKRLEEANKRTVKVDSFSNEAYNLLAKSKTKQLSPEDLKNAIRELNAKYSNENLHISLETGFLKNIESNIEGYLKNIKDKNDPKKFEKLVKAAQSNLDIAILDLERHKEDADKYAEKASQESLKGIDANMKLKKKLLEGSRFSTKETLEKKRALIKFLDLKSFPNNEEVETAMIEAGFKQNGSSMKLILKIRSIEHKNALVNAIIASNKLTSGVKQKALAESGLLHETAGKFEVEHELNSPSIIKSNKNIDVLKTKYKVDELNKLNVAFFDTNEGTMSDIMMRLKLVANGRKLKTPQSPKNETELIDRILKEFKDYPTLRGKLINHIKNVNIEIMTEYLKKQTERDADLITEEKARRLLIIEHDLKVSNASMFTENIKFYVNDELKINQSIKALIKKWNTDNPINRIKLDYDGLEDFSSQNKDNTSQEAVAIVNAFNNIKNIAINKTKSSPSTILKETYLQYLDVLNSLGSGKFSKDLNEADMALVMKIVANKDALEKKTFSKDARDFVDKFNKLFNKKFIDFTNSMYELPSTKNITDQLESNATPELKTFLDSIGNFATKRSKDPKSSVKETLDYKHNTEKFGERMGAIVTQSLLLEQLTSDFKCPKINVENPTINHITEHLKSIFYNPLNTKILAKINEFVDTYNRANPTEHIDLSPGAANPKDKINKFLEYSIDEINKDTDVRETICKESIDELGLTLNTIDATGITIQRPMTLGDIAKGLRDLRILIKSDDFKVPPTTNSSQTLKDNLLANLNVSIGLSKLEKNILTDDESFFVERNSDEFLRNPITSAHKFTTILTSLTTKINEIQKESDKSDNELVKEHNAEIIGKYKTVKDAIVEKFRIFNSAAELEPGVLDALEDDLTISRAALIAAAAAKPVIKPTLEKRLKAALAGNPDLLRSYNTYPDLNIDDEINDMFRAGSNITDINRAIDTNLIADSRALTTLYDNILAQENAAGDTTHEYSNYLKTRYIDQIELKKARAIELIRNIEYNESKGLSVRVDRYKNAKAAFNDGITKLGTAVDELVDPIKLKAITEFNKKLLETGGWLGRNHAKDSVNDAALNAFNNAKANKNLDDVSIADNVFNSVKAVVTEINSVDEHNFISPIAKNFAVTAAVKTAIRAIVKAETIKATKKAAIDDAAAVAAAAAAAGPVPIPTPANAIATTVCANVLNRLNNLLHLPDLAVNAAQLVQINAAVAAVTPAGGPPPVAPALAAGLTHTIAGFRAAIDLDQTVIENFTHASINGNNIDVVTAEAANLPLPADAIDTIKNLRDGGNLLDLNAGKLPLQSLDNLNANITKATLDVAVNAITVIPGGNAGAGNADNIAPGTPVQTMIDAVSGAGAGANAIRFLNIIPPANRPTLVQVQAIKLVDATDPSTLLGELIGIAKSGKADTTEFDTKKNEIGKKLRDYASQDPTGGVLRALYDTFTEDAADNQFGLAHIIGGTPAEKAAAFNTFLGIDNNALISGKQHGSDTKLTQAFRNAAYMNVVANNALLTGTDGVGIQIDYIPDITAAAVAGPTKYNYVLSNYLYVEGFANVLKQAGQLAAKTNIAEYNDVNTAATKATYAFTEKANARTALEASLNTNGALHNDYKNNFLAAHDAVYDQTTPNATDRNTNLVEKVLSEEINTRREEARQQFNIDKREINKKSSIEQALKNEMIFLAENKAKAISYGTSIKTLVKYLEDLGKVDSPNQLFLGNDPASIAGIQTALQGIKALPAYEKILQIFENYKDLTFDKITSRSMLNRYNMHNSELYLGDYTIFENNARIILNSLSAQLATIKIARPKASHDDLQTDIEAKINSKIADTDAYETDPNNAFGKDVTPATLHDFDVAQLNALFQTNPTPGAQPFVLQPAFTDVAILAGGSHKRALTKLRKRARSMTRNKHVREHKKSVIRSDKKKAYKTKRA
jgi:hypothetical protein